VKHHVSNDLAVGDKSPVGLEMVGLPNQEHKLLWLVSGVGGMVKGKKPPAW
jgi:hypothetical protein